MQAAFLFICAILVLGTWYFTREYYKQINQHLTSENAALKDQLFNIKEAKQIYDQLRLLIKPTKKPKRRR